MTYDEKRRALKDEFDARVASLTKQREVARLEHEEQLADIIFLQRAEKTRYEADLLTLAELERLEEEMRLQAELDEQERIEGIGKVTTFDLWNAVAQRKMPKYSPLAGPLDLDAFGEALLFNIVGNPDREVGSVRYEIDYRDEAGKVILQKTQVENRAPHAVFAKDRSATLVNAFNLMPGVLAVTATCFTAIRGGGEAGVPVTLKLTITGKGSGIKPARTARVPMSFTADPNFKEENLPKAIKEPYAQFRTLLVKGGDEM